MRGRGLLPQGDYDTGYLYECEFLDDDEKAKLPRDQLYQPTRVIPIHNSHDKSVTCIHFRFVIDVCFFSRGFWFYMATLSYTFFSRCAAIDCHYNILSWLTLLSENHWDIWDALSASDGLY